MPWSWNVAARLPLRTLKRKHGIAACSNSIFAKESPYDTTSATHDRRHAGSESRSEHADVLRATGVPVCPPLQQIPGTVGARGYSGLPGVPDGRKEVGAWFRSDRGRRPALPLQDLAQTGLAV